MAGNMVVLPRGERPLQTPSFGQSFNQWAGGTLGKTLAEAPLDLLNLGINYAAKSSLQDQEGGINAGLQTHKEVLEAQTKHNAELLDAGVKARLGKETNFGPVAAASVQAGDPIPPPATADDNTKSASSFGDIAGRAPAPAPTAPSLLSSPPPTQSVMPPPSPVNSALSGFIGNVGHMGESRMPTPPPTTSPAMPPPLSTPSSGGSSIPGPGAVPQTPPSMPSLPTPSTSQAPPAIGAVSMPPPRPPTALSPAFQSGLDALNGPGSTTPSMSKGPLGLPVKSVSMSGPVASWALGFPESPVQTALRGTLQTTMAPLGALAAGVKAGAQTTTGAFQEVDRMREARDRILQKMGGMTVGKGVDLTQLPVGGTVQEQNQALAALIQKSKAAGEDDATMAAKAADLAGEYATGWADRAEKTANATHNLSLPVEHSMKDALDAYDKMSGLKVTFQRAAVAGGGGERVLPPSEIRQWVDANNKTIQETQEKADTLDAAATTAAIAAAKAEMQAKGARPSGPEFTARAHELRQQALDQNPRYGHYQETITTLTKHNEGLAAKTGRQYGQDVAPPTKPSGEFVAGKTATAIAKAKADNPPPPPTFHPSDPELLKQRESELVVKIADKVSARTGNVMVDRQTILPLIQEFHTLRPGSHAYDAIESQLKAGAQK